MAAKCAWNGGQSLLEKVADLSTSIDEARGNKSDRQIILEFKKGIISLIRQEVEINIEELPELLPDILEELSFILDDDANLPEPDEIMSWFLTNLDVAEKLEKSMETEDLNKPSEEQQLKEEFDRDFIQLAFGISQNARNLFTGFANSVAVNSFIFSGKDHKHINKSSYDFDVAVRNAQKDLLKTIVRYIRDTYSTNGVVTDSTISKIVSRNNEEDYNDLLIILRGVNSEGKKKLVILNNATLRRVTKYFGNLFEKPENLDKLVSDIIDPNKNITADNKQKVLSKVNAYNSWILLNNFDKFFKKTFSDSININYNKTLFIPGRYSLTSKGTKLYSTWRTTDEIFLDKEINNVTQFIISSLPMLNYNGDKLPNLYLKFSDFTNLITAKIKHLQNLPVTYKDIANFSNVRQILNNLRAQTNDTTLKEVIKVISDPKIKSFHDLIIYSRENPEKYWRTIFYLLGNDNAYKTLGLGTNNNNENSSIHTFTTTDKNVIQTINRQLFNGNTSLANAIDNDGGDELNFLAYITLSIDSMYEAQYGLYYQGEDSDSDSIKVQSLQSTFITSRRRALTRNIQAINSQKRINYKQYKSDFNIVLNTTEYSEDKTKVDSVDFDLQVSKANTIHVKTDSLGKTYFSINNSPLDINTLSDDEMLKISLFVYHILGVNIASDNFLNAYADIKASNVQLVKGQCFTDMLTLSSSILAKMAILNELIGQVDTKKELLEKINTVFNGASSDFKPGVNSLLGEIELISSNRLPLMKTLAEITAYLEHSLSSTQIKDGKGNAASVQTLSRLLGSYPYQWNSLSKIGAALNFSIFGATFLGTEQMKEAKIGSNYKSHVDFNPLEFETAGIVYDYLLSRKNGKLRFIPAIMSDKSYIGRMLIDLNARTKYLVRSGYNINNLKGELYEIFLRNFLLKLGQYLNLDTELLLYELDYDIIPESIKFLCEQYGKSNIDFNMWTKTILKESNIELPFTQYLEIINEGLGNTLNEILSTISSDSLLKEIIYEELGSFYVGADSAIANTWKSVNNALTEIGLPEVLGTDSETIAVTLLNANLPTDFDLNNFELTNLLINTLRALGVTKLSPIDFTKEIVRIYNNLHPTNIIKLTENVHYENNKQNIYSIGDVKYKNNLGRNHTFEYLLEIFSDPKLTAGYFKLGEQSMLSDLLKDNFEIDIVGNPDLKAVIGIDSISKVNGKFILGNITINNNTYEITSNLAAKRIAILAMQEISGNSSYVYSTFSKFLNDLTNLGVDYNIDLNQLLRNYNALDFLYSQEFINSTVGAHYAHPGKLKFKDYNNPTEQEILWEENARYAAQSKRNVSFPATMQEFLLGMLNGIPSKYNIAIISDAHDSVYNVNGDAGGDSGTANPHDGATFVNPFINYLENNSLGGASAGNIKKPFIHFYDEQTGTGGIIKTAGFPLTNYWIKNSRAYLNMMFNMTARKWFDSNGNFTIYNILEGFDVKNPLNKKELLYKNPREQNLDGNNASFAYSDNGQIYRVTNIEYLGNGSYKLTRNLVDQYNQIQKANDTIVIDNVDSNYALWNMFGGYNSLEWNGTKYIPSEYSILAVVSAMNKVGEVIDPNISKIRYLDEVYQPLKYSDIHYMPTAGAVKQGMGNINNLNDVLHKQKPVNFFQINMNQAGILLDKEHEADNEEISLMTLVVSSCIARGYSFDEASEMYLALAALARQGIKNSLNAYENILRNTSQIINNKEKFRDVIVNIIVDSIIHLDSKNSLVESIKLKLISLEQSNYKPTNNELAEMIPFSDAAIFNSLASQLSIDITKSAIKLKIDGVLSILCPAYDIMKIHGGKKLGLYINSNQIKSVSDTRKAQISADYTAQNELKWLARQEESSKEMQDILDKAPRNSIGELLAPNGKVSNLTEKQYAQVRTKAFKKWFGDWENDSENASKVVDENGEPKIFYHYTDNENLNEFDPNFDNYFTTQKDGTHNAFFFTEKQPDGLLGRAKELAVFLNIRDLEVKHGTKDELRAAGEEFVSTVNRIADQKKGDYNGVMFTGFDDNRKTNQTVIVATRPNQIKSATDNVGTFDSNNPDIRDREADITPEDIQQYHRERLDYSNLDGSSEQELEEALNRMPILNKAIDSRINYCYNVTFSDGHTETITIKRPGLSTYKDNGEVDDYGYMSFKNEIEYGNIVSFQENIIEGRDLAHYNCIFNGVILTKEDNLGQIEEHQYQLYDLASTQRLHYLHDNFNNSTLDKFREDLSTIIYFSEIMSDDEIVNYVDHLSDEEVYKELDKLYRRQLQKDLITITEGNGDVEIMTFEDLNGIDEGGHIVHVSNPAQVESAEVILPKYFKTAYGLTEEDELSEINEKGYKFFEEKIRHKISSRISPLFFDIEFKYNNGQHIYVADKLRKPTKLTDTFYKVKAEIRKIDNEYWRIDPETGEKMYRVNNKNDEIWITYTDAGTLLEVIITENPSDYIDILSGYSNIALSTEDYDGNDISNTRDIYFLKIINGKNKRLSKLFSKYINDKGIIDNSFYEEINNPLIYGYASSNELLNDHIEKLAKEMFSSFLKSLELVAARIPALSMQSFMSMKIVAFDSTDSNTSYVASSQLFLQGSDFDIDTTNFTAYSVEKNGKIAHWSNLANFESKELLKASDKLPFPTGEVALDYTLNDIYNKLDITGLILENEKGELILNTNSVENINLLARAIRVVNSDGLNKLYIGQAKTLSDRTKEFVKKIIDSHNVGFYKQNHKLVENATKNYMLTKMHDIIESPKNQIEAQTGIDVATKRVKDVANAEDNPVVLESKSLGVNNALTKMKGINNTLVGKKGVGICAVGMKSFFALQLYNDKVLNNPNSTPELLHRLLLGPDGKGITIGGKTYTKLVNIYKKGLKLFRDLFDDLTEQLRINFVNSKIDELKRLPEGETKLNLSRLISGAVIDILTRSENDDDAAISLSALLSQATDNAKELSLGKINAGTNMLGMYIYGVAIGVPFEEVAKIIMSPTAKIVAGMMEGNIFNNQKSMTIQEVFDYFIYGPDLELYNFKKKDLLLDSNGNFLLHDKHESVTEKTNFPHSEAIYYVANKIEKLIDEHDEHPLADLISKLNFDKYSLNDQITFFESLKLHGDTSEYAMCINQVVDICENYITNKYNVLVEDKQNYEDLLTLAEGAEEFKVLGQLLHVNQGLETSLDRQMAYIDKFNLINTRLSTINRKRKRENKNSIEVEAYLISLDDFIQNPEKCIERYEKIDGTNIKHTFNLLDVLHNDDHFNMYTRSAWLLDKELYEISSKYKTIKYWSPIVKLLLGKVQDNTVVKGLSRMYDTYVTSDWLLSHSFGPNNDQPLTIYLSDEEKQLIEGPFSKAGNIKLLGTDEGKALYIAWIEKVVIPNLKLGINGLKNPDDSYSINYALKNNKFIQGLEMNLFTNTPTHLNTLAYSLPINMSPRSDDEKNALQEYKTAFNLLNNTAYGYYQTANGEIFNLLDLFFIYNLIAHYNAPGEKTLTNIFSDSNDYGLIKLYRDFEGKFNANEVITKDNISTNYVMAFCIPTSSISIAESKYAWTTSTNAFLPTLMVKLTKDEYLEEYEDDNIPREIPKRNFKGEKYVTAFNNELLAKPNTPDFPVNTNQITSSELVIDGKKYLFTIEHVNGRIIKLAYKLSDGYVINLVIDLSTNGSTLLNFDNLKNKLKLVPNFSLSSDGKIIEDWQLDLSKIQDLIENDINKCN